jgi:general secretion pathway protein G
MKNMQRQQGFSLLELMVVLVILGILASMIVPNVMDSQSEGERQKVVSDIVALENALDMYRLQNGNYPTTEQGVEALVEEPRIDPLPRRYPEGGYIRRLPSDPWGNEYQLLNPGQYSTIDVFSAGPDGQTGTDDDIGNWNLDEYQEQD